MASDNDTRCGPQRLCQHMSGSRYRFGCNGMQATGETCLCSRMRPHPGHCVELVKFPLACVPLLKASNGVDGRRLDALNINRVEGK